MFSGSSKTWNCIHPSTLTCLMGTVLILLIMSACAPEINDPNPNDYIINGPQDLYPAFSRDGKFIAYYHDAWVTPEPPAYPSGLYIIDANGDNRKLVLEGHFESPSWSPNGRWLAFSSSGSLYKCTINGDSLSRFNRLDSLENPGTYYPSWTNDNQFIVFDKALNPGYGIYTTSTDFKTVDALFDLAVTGRDAELSRDGAALVFERGGPGIEHMEIFKISLTSNTEIQLTENKKDNRSPTWSADGSRIAWSSNLELFVMNSDGTGQEKIGYGNCPSWSPSNEIVVSHSNEDYTKEVLYVTDLAGSRVQITF